MRGVFQQIILHNICKASKIQTGECYRRSKDWRACFESLDLVEILDRQNILSKDLKEGFIWVLNT